MNELDADMIAVTGDLVDGSVRDLVTAHRAARRGCTARHGTYFVTGNHEYYSGERAWIAEFRRLGLARADERARRAEPSRCAHSWSPASPTTARTTSTLRSAAIPQRRWRARPPARARSCLLAHQPRSAPAASAAGFDLQLSGHTHGGQFWPWNLFVRLQQPFTAGLHRLNHLWVYISRGTGYWGPPKRFGAPSEITRLRLVPA